MKNELKYIFENVNDWLKFSEAKHAGLIVLNTALIIGILSSFISLSKYVYKIPTLLLLTSLGISLAGSLFSQFPKTSNFLIRRETNLQPNIYFFGDLGKISLQQFVKEFKKSNNEFEPDNSDKKLINQILINSRITCMKFKLFKFCTWATIFGIGVFGFSAIIKILWL